MSSLLWCHFTTSKETNIHIHIFFFTQSTDRKKIQNDGNIHIVPIYVSNACILSVYSTNNAGTYRMTCQLHHLSVKRMYNGLPGLMGTILQHSFHTEASISGLKHGWYMRHKLFCNCCSQIRCSNFQ